MSVVGEIGNHRLDLAVGHILRVGMHDFVLAQERAKILELVLEIVRVLACDARGIAGAFAVG